MKHYTHSQTFLSNLPFNQVTALLLVLCLGVFALSPAWAADMPAPASEPVTASQLASAHPDVNINQASADELAEALVGVGAVKAEAIVNWRQQHGDFNSIDEIAQVKGIGAATLEKNKQHIRL